MLVHMSYNAVASCVCLTHGQHVGARGSGDTSTAICKLFCNYHLIYHLQTQPTCNTHTHTRIAASMKHCTANKTKDTTHMYIYCAHRFHFTNDNRYVWVILSSLTIFLRYSNIHQPQFPGLLRNVPGILDNTTVWSFQPVCWYSRHHSSVTHTYYMHAYTQHTHTPLHSCHTLRPLV